MRPVPSGALLLDDCQTKHWEGKHELECKAYTSSDEEEEADVVVDPTVRFALTGSPASPDITPPPSRLSTVPLLPFLSLLLPRITHQLPHPITLSRSALLSPVLSLRPSGRTCR